MRSRSRRGKRREGGEATIRAWAILRRDWSASSSGGEGSGCEWANGTVDVGIDSQCSSATAEVDGFLKGLQPFVSLLSRLSEDCHSLFSHDINLKSGLSCSGILRAMCTKMLRRKWWVHQPKFGIWIDLVGFAGGRRDTLAQ